MWIPKWLGEIYSKLFINFTDDIFTFQNAKNCLLINENKLAVALSKLHSKRALLIIKHSKPRLYRLLDPESFLFLATENVKNVDKIPQERYVKLICNCYLHVSREMKVGSFAIYGSVARGDAKNNSDIDILLISEDFHGSLGSRIERLYKFEKALKDELRWLRKQNIYTSLSFYPLIKEEAERLPYLFLDLTEEAIILHDENHFLENLLLNLKTRLLKQGAKRIFIDKQHWYWDLKPDYKFGEVIAVA